MIVIKFIMIYSLSGVAFSHAEPIGVIRITQKSTWWLKERDAIVESYRKNLTPPEGSKIFPLFICVSLSLGDPASEFGANIYEAAFVYTEIPLENGSKKREVVAFFRSPYWANREWNWEPTAIKDSLTGRFAVEDNADLSEQLLKFGKQVDASAGPGLQKIKMVIFEKEIIEAFGRDLDDTALKNILQRPEADVKKPE